jgi:uncharacterized membrane protein
VNPRVWLYIVRICSLFAILTSAALATHYLAPEATGFCAVRSGCEAVRRSALSSAVAPQFIPLAGVLAYAIVYWLTFWPEYRRVLMAVGAFGGVIALGLVVHQAVVINAFCWLCLIVDTLAVIIAFASVAYGRGTNVGTEPLGAEPLRGFAWMAFFGLALAIPTVWVRIKPEHTLPRQLQQMQREGAINVFEFADVQCPHCRHMHPLLRGAVYMHEKAGHKVNFKRFHIPLPIHPLAEGGARAAVCGETMGKGEEMADLLFTTPLDKDIWFKHAKQLGLNEDEFRTCLDSDATNQTLSDAVDLFNALGAQGLPMTYIGQQGLKGTQPGPVVVEAFAKAAGPQPYRWSGELFLAVVAAAVGGIVAAAWKREKATASPTNAPTAT